MKKAEMKKIDIHCHILPEVDDGAKNIEQSLEMLRIAAKDGITDIIATPHFHYRRGHATPEEIRRKVQELNAAAKAEGINITVYPGNELYYTHELLEKVKAGEALTLADSDYVLLEFSPDVEKSKLQRAVYKFLGEGYYPIIAHMERYEAFRKDREFAYTIEEMGAYYQINAGSLMGSAGWNTKRFARTMLEQGMVKFIATDAHDTNKRYPGFGKAAEWIAKKYGEEDLWEYLRDNPQKIIENLGI